MSRFSDWLRQKKAPSCSVVVAAAGSSARMGSDKLFMDLGGMPVLARTLLALDRCVYVDEIVVVTREDKILEVADMCRLYGICKASKIVVGGSTRQESVLAGLSEISASAKLVAVHDGARPFVTSDLFERVAHLASLYQSAAPVVPLNDTIKFADNGLSAGTLDRSRLVAMQTPQIFVPELVKAALTRAVKENSSFTDDCSAVEALGVPTRFADGSSENIKLTTPLDMELALTILKKREREGN
ncbi:MAG: 2-C-methyl-D-erythritol 4-phosphate cytidylyltransferase [Eubacteriales bacterium]|nr:2-C-methyl-D-erythritol 4-phosphate cytidylyltransferase [Eubacteriales bacterium]